MAYLPWISRNEFIGCGKHDTFDLGLSDQHAIKWIIMDWRQTRYRQSMLARDCKLMPAVLDQGASQPGWLHPEIFAAKPVFYGYFP
jgi:hypothetical protein